MPSCKKIIRNTFGYLILALNTIAANHFAPTSEVTLGKKIYHDRCEVCHGSQGDGKTFAANALFPPPKNFTTRTTKKPWESVLSKQEIYSVVDYIRQVLMRPQK